jgi:hypothetical protein
VADEDSGAMKYIIPNRKKISNNTLSRLAPQTRSRYLAVSTDILL